MTRPPRYLPRADSEGGKDSDQAPVPLREPFRLAGSLVTAPGRDPIAWIEAERKRQTALAEAKRDAIRRAGSAAEVIG